MTVFLDVSKLVDDPRRSGIQRAERALIRFWPGDDTLVLCRYDGRGGVLRTLKHETAALLCADAAPGGPDEERALLAPYLARPGAVVPADARLLCAELFDHPGRAAYHQAAGPRAHWLVYDFLPWLHPEWFPAGPANRLMPFLRAMGSVRRAYISAATRADAARLFRRPQDGPVVPLGADGLRLEPQRFDPVRRDVVLLGTIEARKNAAAAVAAFRTLWAEGCDVRLVLVGAVEPDALIEQALLRELAGEPRLVLRGVLSDADLCAAFRTARALLFPSQGEGYGLPPIEALAAGMPVIVAADLPATRDLPALGQIRLPVPDPAAIASAVRTLLDDAAAARLWQEAATLRLPGWGDFAGAVADWVGAGVSAAAAARDPVPA